MLQLNFPVIIKRLALLLLLCPMTTLDSAEPWSSELKDVRIRSSADRTEQNAMWWSPTDPTEARPLLVGLHTWSADYLQTGSSLPYWQWCQQQGWHFIHPNFRGANRTPEALGSDLAVQDIVDAVEWAKAHAKIDARRIYLIGVSGGGHMSLVMAGRHPEIWAGVSAWCGLFDIARWHGEHTKGGKPDNYARQIESALKGPPDTPARRADARHRSPIAWLAGAGPVPLDIAAGVHDGRKGSVPFQHSLDAFNAVHPQNIPLSETDIASYYATQKLPSGWPAAAPNPLFGKRQPLFQAHQANTRVTIFEGGHEIVHEAALNWLLLQEKGKPAVWQVKNPIKLSVQGDHSKSGL